MYIVLYTMRFFLYQSVFMCVVARNRGTLLFLDFRKQLDYTLKLDHVGLSLFIEIENVCVLCVDKMEVYCKFLLLFLDFTRLFD